VEAREVQAREKERAIAGRLGGGGGEGRGGEGGSWWPEQPAVNAGRCTFTVLPRGADWLAGCSLNELGVTQHLPNDLELKVHHKLCVLAATWVPVGCQEQYLLVMVKY
jgi:hypothetical protein